MGLVANGIYGYRVAGNATLLGSLPPRQRNSVQNALTWSSAIRQYVSFPYGYYRSAFVMSLKYGAIGAKLNGSSVLISDIYAVGVLTSTLIGGGNIINARIAAGRNIGALIIGSGQIIDAEIQAPARMKATIRIGAAPSAFDIAQAVWTLQAAGINIPGTTGEKINSAGATGDPWSTDLSTGGYTGNQAGKKIQDIKNDTGLIPGAL